MTGDVGADEDVLRVARIDRDPADRAVARDGGAARDERPVVAAVGRAVEAEPGLGVARAALFTGARVDRAATLVGRVDQQRADRGRRNAAADRSPVRIRIERIVRPPDAAAGGRDEERAVLAALVGAAWIDCECRHAARPLRRPVERLRGERGHVVRERAELLPRAAVLRAVALELSCGVRRRARLRDADARERIRLVGVGLRGRIEARVGVAGFRAAISLAAVHQHVRDVSLDQARRQRGPVGHLGAARARMRTAGAHRADYGDRGQHAQPNGGHNDLASRHRVPPQKVENPPQCITPSAAGSQPAKPSRGSNSLCGLAILR